MAKDKGTAATMTAPVPTTSPAPSAPAHDALSGLTHITEDADLRMFETRLARLHERRLEATAKLETLTTELNALRTITAESRFADALTTNPDAPQVDHSLVSLSAERDAVVQELAALDRASKTMTDSVGPIETLKAELCAAACRAVAPLHRQHARGVVNGLLTLYAAQQQQGRLHDQLWEKGYDRTSHLVNIFVTDFGLISDSGSWISAMLRDFTESGVISEDERIRIIQGEMTQLEAHA